jgi:hypothetical protein
MSSGEEAYRRIQAAARSVADKTGVPVPTQEYLVRHLLESFLDRLTRTMHAEDFVLKGGILLAAHGFAGPPRTWERLDALLAAEEHAQFHIT